MIDKDDAQDVLQPYFPDLRNCIEDGWRAWTELGRTAPKLRAVLRNRTRANVISDHIAASVIETFRHRAGVRLVEHRGFPELVIKGKYVIRFKKLDKNGRSRNILTKAQRAWFQQQMQLPDLPPAAERLIAGYVLDELGTEISRVLVTAPLNVSEVEWKIELPETDDGKVIEMPKTPRQPKPPKVRSTQQHTAEGEDDDNAS